MINASKHTVACQMGTDMCNERKKDARLDQIRLRFSVLVAEDFDAAEKLINSFGVKCFENLEEDQLTPFSVALLSGVRP